MTHGSHLTDRDFLQMIDDDVHVRADAEAHLAACAGCRRAFDALQAWDATLVQSSDATPAWDADLQRARTRARLEARLALESGRSPLAWLTGRGIVAAVSVAAMLAFAVTIVRRSDPIETTTDIAGLEAGVLPIRHLTPGATWPMAADELCRARPVEPAPIPKAIRESVLRAYGMQDTPAHEYELDYLVTPDLGGAPHPDNLWPEPYGTHVWNARVKDQLEELLPELVCDGKVDLATAQHDIAVDWIAAYKKYFKTDRPVSLYSALPDGWDGPGRSGRSGRPGGSGKVWSVGQGQSGGVE